MAPTDLVTIVAEIEQLLRRDALVALRRASELLENPQR